MAVLPYIYLSYMFISLYFLSFFIILYVMNRGRFLYYPPTPNAPLVSFVVPAYNEGATIADSIHHIFKSYDAIKEVIVVNDCSTDNTRDIVERLQGRYQNIILVNNPRNLGNAARSQNVGLTHVTSDFVAIVDADSFPASGAIYHMIGFLLADERVGAVTCPVVARNKNLFFEKIQAIEYVVISFGRKLLEYVDAIYVTPGPLALYRKTALDDIGGFDESNMTQDIEATWHLAAKGWKRKMSLATHVSSSVPQTLRGWWVQRRRWNIGGLQCLYKYKGIIGRKGMLGLFIIPFFLLNLFLGMVGLGIFFYLMGDRVVSRFLFTQYSLEAGTALVTLDQFYITPSVLNYLGIILFVFGFLFALLGMAALNERVLKRENILNIPFYLTVYLILYPFIMVNSIWFAVQGKHVWR